jgi:AAA15 family ATPase/GTPase
MEEKTPPAYISHVQLKGYKSVRNLEVRLNEGLNIIIGKNGSGKTNFVEFLGNVMTMYNEIDKPYHAVVELKNKTEHIIFDEKFEGDYQYYENINKKFPIVDTKIIDKIANEEAEFDIRITSFIIRRRKTFHSFINPTKVLFSIPPSFGKYMLSELGSIYGSLEDVNSELNVIYNVFQKDIELSFGVGKTFPITKTTVEEYLELNKDLIKNLKKYSPIQDLRLSKSLYINDETSSKIDVNYIMLEFFVNNKWLTWKKLSDGTKRIFYIIYEIISSYGLVFLEEPENGVHPDQLYLLMDFIKEQSKEKQIIMTTHSPEVLNILEKDELDRIIVTRFDGENGTQMHHLSEKQKKKGQAYMNKIGHLSAFWLHSNLEKYDETKDK